MSYVPFPCDRVTAMRPNGSLRWSVFGKWQEWFRTKFGGCPLPFQIFADESIMTPHVCMVNLMNLMPHSPESTYLKGPKKSLPSDCIRGFVFYVDLDVDIMRICSKPVIWKLGLP